MPLDEEGVKFTIDVSQATTGVRDLAKDASALAAVMATLDKGTDEVSKGFVEFHTELSKTIPLIDQTTASVAGLTATAKNTGSELDGLGRALLGATGTGSGESGVGGFAGLSSNALKAEKVINAMITGGSLARTGPMLESITTALGMTSGVGFAVGGLMFAVQALIPHLETFFGYMDPEKLKASGEQMRELAAQAAKMSALKPPEEVEKAADVTKLVAAQGGMEVRQGVVSSLREAGWGLSDADKKTMAKIAGMRARGEWVEPALVGEEARIAARQEMAIVGTEEKPGEARRLMAQLPISKEARQTVAGMAIRRPGAFGAPAFGEALAFYDDEKAQEESRRADEELEQKDAERQGRKTARFEAAKVKNQREKDWQHGLNVQDTVFRQMDKEEDETKKRGNIAEANELLKRQNEEKHAADEARRKAEKAAHAALPSVQLEEGAKRDKENVIRQLQAIDLANQQRGGPAATPEFMQAKTHEALSHVRAGFDIATSVRAVVDQTVGFVVNQVEQGLRQQSQMNAAMWQRQNGNQMFNPTQSNRGDGG
jgi:hypothetical protein